MAGVSWHLAGKPGPFASIPDDLRMCATEMGFSAFMVSHWPMIVFLCSCPMVAAHMHTPSYEQNQRDLNDMLTKSQIAAIADGTAEIENFIVVKPAAEI